MTFPDLMKEPGLGGNLGGNHGGRSSVTSRVWLVCQGLLFMKRVAIAQRNLHRSIHHHRWSSESTVSTSTRVPNFSRDVEENADYEKLTRAEVLKLWQDINDMTAAAEINGPNQKEYFQDTAACTPDQVSALRTVPGTPWRKFISKFNNHKQRLGATNTDSRIVQMSFIERLRTWLHIQDSRARWPQGWI